jgi:hypothetical protein
MFQKLYKHLEEMNGSLREQCHSNAETKQLAERTSEQLDSVKDSMLVQNKLLISQNMLSKEVFSQSRRGLGPVLQAANLFLSCVGFVVIVIFSYYTFELSRITGKLLHGQSLSSGQATPSGRAASFVRQTGQPSVPADKLPGQMGGSLERPAGMGPQAGTEQHLAKLDSLISEQAQSIKELRKLNTISVRTFSHIRRHLDLADGRAAK